MIRRSRSLFVPGMAWVIRKDSAPEHKGEEVAVYPERLYGGVESSVQDKFLDLSPKDILFVRRNLSLLMKQYRWDFPEFTPEELNLSYSEVWSRLNRLLFLKAGKEIQGFLGTSFPK